VPCPPGRYRSRGARCRSCAQAGVALLGLFGLIGPPLLLTQRRRRPLLAQPWRRCPATAAATTETAILDRLIVFEGERSLVLRGTLPDVPDLVLAQQELFLVGPDEKGRALVRVAGLCQMFPVRVDTAEARPKEREPGRAGHPPHPRAFRRLRHGAHAWRYAVAVGVLGAVVLTLGLWPLSPLALVVGGVLLAVAAVTTPTAVRSAATTRRQPPRPKRRPGGRPCRSRCSRGSPRTSSRAWCSYRAAPPSCSSRSRTST
jgi:hypothetical protein